MMKRTFLIVLLGAFCFTMTFAQTDEEKARLEELKKMNKTEDVEGWQRGGGIGMDLSQLMLINPKVGAGQNKIGFGGLANFFAKYKQGKVVWDNSGSLQYVIQRIGLPTSQDNPFTKNLDDLRLASNYGYQLNEKLYASFDATFQSQISPTYPGNLLSAIGDEEAISNLFSPAFLTLSPGIKYIWDDHLNFFFSPASAKIVMVMNDYIASIPGDVGAGRGLYGTEQSAYGIDGLASEFKKTDFQLGATLKANYNNKMWEDRITYASTLTLFSNYLREPQNIDVDWQNDFSWNIYKGLSLNLGINFFYDHDVLVQISDSDSPVGVSGLGRRVSITEALLLKYNFVF